MLQNLLSFFHANDSLPASRRQFARYNDDRAVAWIDGIFYPIRDWSRGGLSFGNAPDSLQRDQILRLILRFDLLEEVIEMPVALRILRAENGEVAGSFLPLSSDARRKLGRVADLKNAEVFLRSQVSNDIGAAFD